MTARLRALLLHLALSFASAAAMHHAAAETREGPGGARLARVDLATLPAFAGDDAAAAFAVYRASCARIVEQAPELRAGLAPECVPWPLAYGAWWASLEWRGDGFEPHALVQRYDKASVMIGRQVGVCPGSVGPTVRLTR